MLIDDVGVCAIAKWCPRLRIVSLKVDRVGYLGVILLVNSAMDLTTLDLRVCILVTDVALEAIGESKSIISLNLEGCSRIMDCGLASFAKGPVSKNLKALAIARSHRITDSRVLHLGSMCCLEVLDMAWMIQTGQTLGVWQLQIRLVELSRN